MFKYIFIALFCLIPAFGFAQDKPRAILVLDASDSMWGQIDGKAKITIAQDVIGDLLQSLPRDQQLGLTVYGHRRKGDCSDIETLILPEGDTRSAIAHAVDGIRPKGKTPLSAAVIQAAEALKYTEERATVILVSDGRETCELDPCEVGRKLEEAGIDFTAHVIGFDISDAKDRAELQCLAHETGGTFRTASNASELSEALQVVAEPEPISVGFRATDGKDGAVITDQLVWELFSNAGTTLAQTTSSAKEMGITLFAGNYRIEVMRVKDKATAQRQFSVSDHDLTIILALPVFIPPMSLDAPGEAPIGSEITVQWTGPDYEHDFIALIDPDGNIKRAYAYSSVGTRDGNPVRLKMPTTPGEYELRYVTVGGDKNILMRKAITATPVEVNLDAPETAAVGSEIEATWTGPDYEHDFIALTDPDENIERAYAYSSVGTRDGNPVRLKMPTTPGEYELRYVTVGGDKSIMHRRKIIIKQVSASFDVSDTVQIRSVVSLKWTGPGLEGDRITLAQPDWRAGQYADFAPISEGNPLELQMPPSAGEYELRYMLKDGTIIARKPLTVQ